MSVPRVRSGELEGDHGHPMIEVLTKAPVGDGAPKIEAGRGDEHDVDGLGARAAKTTDTAVLEDGEELALERSGQQSDLVEEQSAEVRRLDQPRFGLTSVGEGAALVAEEFRFQKGLRNGRTIDVDEAVVAARPGVMKRARQQPLACSGLPEDQDGRQMARARLTSQQLRDLFAECRNPRALAFESLQRDRHRLHPTYALPPVARGWSDLDPLLTPRS